MANQQTAVEWLMSNLKLTIPQSQFNDVVIQDLFKLAKRMEKVQIMETWKHGNMPTFLGETLTAEKYYNETFKP
jgi:hypothetical protein